NVFDPAVEAAGGLSLSSSEGSGTGTQTVATFTDPGGAEALADYSADIKWGDGATTSGNLSVSGGVFTVSGSHTYTEEGTYTISVVIHHDVAPDAIVTDTANVSDPAVVATGGFSLSACERSTARTRIPA